jgi:hypothetical protein
LEKEEQLILALGQRLNGRKQDGDVVFLLALDDRRWMLAGRREVDAVVRALNLHQAFGSATHCADGLMKRRACAALLA